MVGKIRIFGIPNNLSINNSTSADSYQSAKNE